MSCFFCRSSLLLLALFCVTFGVLPAVVASSPLTPAFTSSTDVTARSDVNDGFQRTVKAFQGFEKVGSEITAFLQKLHEGASAAYPSDPVKQQEQFLRKLNERYSGSTYDGRTGTVAFQKNFVATFDSSLKVDSIREYGIITITYEFER